MMLATVLTMPSARRWRDEQTAAEERIRERARAIREKTEELQGACHDLRRAKTRLDLTIRAGRRLLVPADVSRRFTNAFSDLGHRITGHD